MPPAPAAAEQPGGGQARHRDLVALSPVDPGLAADEDATEQPRRSHRTSTPRAGRPAPATTRCRAGSGSRSRCRPSSFGSTKYRKASAEATNTSVASSRPRVRRKRGSSSPFVAVRPARPGVCSGDVRRRSAATSRPSGLRGPGGPPRGAGTEASAAAQRVADPLRQRRAADQVDRVVLAEVDQREAEHPGVRPATRRPPGRTSNSSCAPMSDVAKCSDGMAASGFPPRTS